ncbi:MAG: ABC transporter permease [Chloroflexi bacterium]|nr:ABC transporter permease [Chloroflexota bacterium]MBV9893282.1 ABC transporter permease [Chloroflexota bacterium]
MSTLVEVAPASPATSIRPAPGGAYALLAAPPRRHGHRLAVFQTIPSALAALRSNKFRSLLTTLGIIIGVGAVIAIVALGEGASASVSDRLSGLGVNVLTITPGSANSGGVKTGAGGATSLKAADADAIASKIDGITGISPVVGGGAQVVAGNQNWQTRIQSVRPVYATIEDWTIEQGTFFTTQDDADASNVAVLGQTVYTNLFPNNQPAVGQLIRIRNVPFTVIGVLATKGAGVGGDQDDTVLIPFRTGQVRLFGANNVGQIVLQMADANLADTVTQQIEPILRSRHELRATQTDDFTIRSNNDVIARVEGVSQTLTLLLGSVAAVSLVVGGIGIMNIMLVSVTERTREIGIRLAVGAEPRDIMAQFLVEAIVLSALGGFIGILLGMGIAAIMPYIAGWTTAMPWNAITLAFGVSALIGVFFGFYPAQKASRLDPIVALRYE